MPEKKVPPDKRPLPILMKEQQERDRMALAVTNVEVKDEDEVTSTMKKALIQDIQQSPTKKPRLLTSQEKQAVLDDPHAQSMLQTIHGKSQPTPHLMKPPPPPSDTQTQTDETPWRRPAIPSGAAPPVTLSNTELVEAIKSLLQHSEPLQEPVLSFQATSGAAQKNMQIIRDYDFDFTAILNPPTRCVTSFGSEFKSPIELERLLKAHPRWPTLRHFLTHGVEYPLRPIEEEERTKDVAQALDRGNHKSADKKLDFLVQAIKKGILKGWMILIPKDDAEEIPDLEVAPMGVATHIGVTETGEFMPKDRITHDLSYPGGTSETSINSRMITEDMEPMLFGHALRRVIHYIVSLRARHPKIRIFIRKEDLKSAYRRMHLGVKSVVKTAVQVEIDGVQYVLLSLRLPFGGANCPGDFSLLSDVSVDITNDLLQCEEWDFTTVQSPFAPEIPAAKPLPDEVEFGQVRELSVDIPVNDNGKTDGYIDDLITVVPDIGDNIDRARIAPCTVLHALAQSTDGETHIPRDNLIAEDKNEAEGAPEEQKICLGWLLDTCRLTASLPEHKHKAWSSQIHTLLNQQTTDEATLASVLGRLENVASLLRMAGHFLNNIRSLLLKTQHRNSKAHFGYFRKSKHPVKIPRQVKEDLRIGLQFLDKAVAGISMNLLTFRKPTRTYISDAAEHGISGFNTTSGKAWSYVIPENLRGRAHINLLEYLGQVICIWLDILDGTIEEEDCLLSMGDSTSALGWMRRSNFRATEGTEAEKNEDWIAKEKVSRKLAQLVLDSNTVLYSQWFAGAHNIIADSLSRDAYFLLTHAHEAFLRIVAPQQVPPNFRIQQLPNEISSFITSTLQQLPVQQQRLKPPKASDLARGNTGVILSLASDMKKNSSSTVSPTSIEMLSSVHSPNQSDNAPTLEEVEENWWQEQSRPPVHMWHRSLGQTNGRTLDWTLEAASASSSKNSSKVTRTKTEPNANRKRYRWQRSEK